MKNKNKIICKADILRGTEENFIYVTYENGKTELIASIPKKAYIGASNFEELTKMAALEVLSQKLRLYYTNLVLSDYKTIEPT